jgi:hypothetical protein
VSPTAPVGAHTATITFNRTGGLEPQTVDVTYSVGNVRISWAANREAAVNRAGGGYWVYVGTSPNFDINTAIVGVTVPYVLGPLAPTTAAVQLASGTYYIKVVAYSSLNPTGSVPSSEFSVTVP